MARKFGFKPSMKQQIASHQAAQDFYEMSLPVSDPRYKAAQIRANIRAQKMVDKVALAKPRAAPVQREAPVVAAISELLARHPRVIWAARFNSGMASYEARSGRYQPVWFHKFLRMPEPMRMPDFFGITTPPEDSIGWRPATLAIEAKAPGWTKPRDDREREQAAFLKMIRDAGGIGIFATDAQEVADALR